METTPDTGRELAILDQIERDPDVTQAGLASQLGVAVGTVNWHLKRLISKGYVKIKRAERRKLRYIITADGLALRARLTVDYIEQQFNLYRRVRERTKEHITKIRSAGYHQVRLIGSGDVTDICKLTCIEQDIKVVDDPSVPVLEVLGLSIKLRLDTQNE